MMKFLYILGFIWVLPANLIAWTFLLILWARGDIEEVTIDDTLIMQWDLANDSWLHGKLLGTWFGFALGSNILIRDSHPAEKYKKRIKHEHTHAIQNYIFGIFFYPVYFMISIFIYCFLWEKHAYLDNPFERWARRSAGQTVDKPREDWPNGPNDRWNYW